MLQVGERMLRVEDRTDLAKRTPGHKRSVDSISLVVLHHTATPHYVEPDNITYSHGGQTYHAPYHYLVYTSGRVVKTRPVSRSGVCVHGWNSRSVCVAGVGDWEDTDPTTDRFVDSISALVELLTRVYRAGVVLHRDLTQTVCPGRNFPFGHIMARVNMLREVHYAQS